MRSRHTYVLVACPRGRGCRPIVSSRLVGLPQISHPSSYFVWLPLPEGARADRIAASLAREHVSVATAEPFAISTPVPQAIRLALGSVDLPSLRAALSKVAEVAGLDAYS